MVHFACNFDCITAWERTPQTTCLYFSSHTSCLCQLQRVEWFTVLYQRGGNGLSWGTYSRLGLCLQKLCIFLSAYGIGSSSDCCGTRILPFSSFLTKAFVYTTELVSLSWKSSCPRSKNLFGVCLAHDLWDLIPYIKCTLSPFIHKLQSLSASSFFSGKKGGVVTVMQVFQALANTRKRTWWLPNDLLKYVNVGLSLPTPPKKTIH